MLQAFGVIGFRWLDFGFFFPKMVKEGGGQLFQHLVMKLEMPWVQPEEVIFSPKTVSLPFFK